MVFAYISLMDLKARLKHIHIVGDRVLVKPLEAGDRSLGGLFLPPTVQEKEKTAMGIVARVGPGILIPTHDDEDEFWKPATERKYIPLEVEVGDIVVYLQKFSIEISINGETFFIVPYHAILLYVRE